MYKHVVWMEGIGREVEREEEETKEREGM